MSEGISPAPLDGDYVVKLAQELIQVPAENPPGDYSEVAERIMGELKAPGVDRIETHEFVSVRPNFIIQAGEGARAVRAATSLSAATWTRMVGNGEPFQVVLVGRFGGRLAQSCLDRSGKDVHHSFYSCAEHF